MRSCECGFVCGCDGEDMGVGDDWSALREGLLRRFDWIWEKGLGDFGRVVEDVVWGGGGEGEVS